MKRNSAKKTESASQLIDARVTELGDWRGELIARLRAPVGEVELALLWHRGSGLVSQLPYVHKLREGRLLSRRVAAAAAARRVQEQGRAIP